MLFRKLLGLLFVLIAVASMKRKSKDNRNETRKLKRRAQALLRKNLAIAKAEQDRLENLRSKKAKSRLKKTREDIKKR